jgi:hypothetical protein
MIFFFNKMLSISSPAEKAEKPGNVSKSRGTVKKSLDWKWRCVEQPEISGKIFVCFIACL